MVIFMVGKVLLPPNYQTFGGKLIFLAGPIQGAPSWHDEAIRIIQGRASELNIASPSRDVDERYLAKNLTELNPSLAPGQRIDWETDYLGLASRTGSILFWFPLEETHYCDRPYAQTSRVEVSEWMTKSQRTGSHNMVVGFQPSFSGEDYLRYRFAKEDTKIPIYSTLEETCLTAVEQARSR